MTDLEGAVQRARRRHWRGARWLEEDVDVVREVPVTLFVNGADYVTAALTPVDVVDWGIGVLAGDGLVEGAEQVTVKLWRPDDGQLWFRVPGLGPLRDAPRFLGSCCGQSRPLFFQPDVLPPLQASLTLAVDDVQQAFRQLDLWSRRQHSGGLHVAGLARDGCLQLARADVGRHNALDKLFGALLQSQPPIVRDHAYVLFSGRLSAEILYKIRRMAIPVIVSNTAPTDYGLKLAHEFGITAVGFARDGELSVYTHPERIR